MDRESRIVRDESRVRPPSSEVERLLADTTKAQQLFGWSPRRSLDEGLSETIDWIAEHLEEYRVGAYTI